MVAMVEDVEAVEATETQEASVARGAASASQRHSPTIIERAEVVVVTTVAVLVAASAVTSEAAVVAIMEASSEVTTFKMLEGTLNRLTANNSMVTVLAAEVDPHLKDTTMKIVVATAACAQMNHDRTTTRATDRHKMEVTMALRREEVEVCEEAAVECAVAVVEAITVAPAEDKDHRRASAAIKCFPGIMLITTIAAVMTMTCSQ